jgi:hypothetical protein
MSRRQPPAGGLEASPARRLHLFEGHEVNARAWGRLAQVCAGDTLGDTSPVPGRPSPSGVSSPCRSPAQTDMRTTLVRSWTATTTSPRWGSRVRIPSSARMRGPFGPSFHARVDCIFAPATRVIRRGGRVVRQGSAKPCTPVQFRSPPRPGGTMPDFGRLAQG